MNDAQDRSPEESEDAPRTLGIIGGSLRLREPARVAEMDTVRDWLAAGARRGLEIGFGDGSFLVSCAQGNPAVRFLGLEVKRRLVEEARSRAERFGVDNVRVLDADARAALPLLLGPGSLSQVWILFPDPWWKKRHWERRTLFVPDFLELLHGLLEPGGVLAVVTDVLARAEHARELVAEHGGFVPCDEDRIVPPPEATTKRERRCRHHSIPFTRMRWRRQPGGS